MYPLTMVVRLNRAELFLELWEVFELWSGVHLHLVLELLETDKYFSQDILLVLVQRSPTTGHMLRAMPARMREHFVGRLERLCEHMLRGSKKRLRDEVRRALEDMK